MSNTKTQTTAKLTIATQQELKALKKQINEGHDTVEQMKDNLKGEANKILTEAILEGERLNKCKKLLPYGAFGRWLKENCKKISTRTAQRYMTLATRKAELLKTDSGLRAAYQIVGIIKDDDVESTTETSPVVVQQPATSETKKPDVNTLASKAAQKARSMPSAMPTISKDDVLSRAKFLASGLLNELNNKLISNSIMKDDASTILQPLLSLVA